MIEFELKLEIAPERLAAVARAMGARHSRGRRLLARYFDTADEALARAGIVLRLRKEGRVWVQTAKCEGERALERLEHNVTLGVYPGAVSPEISLVRHAGTPLAQRIKQALGLESLDQPAPLLARFETDVQRCVRMIEHAGSVVELALDRGKVIAGGAQLALCEIEFELTQGDALAVVTLARQWCAQHGLRLSSVSKSEKGRRLASGQPFGQPVAATAVRMRRHAGADEMAGAVVSSCLRQILDNAVEIGNGSEHREHVHQLRIGLRRLRTALRELRGIAPPLDGASEAALVNAFRELGRVRDQDFLAGTVQPILMAQGGPPVNVVLEGAMPDPRAVVESAAFQDALFGLLEVVYRGGAKDGGPGEHAKIMKTIQSRLEKLLVRVLEDGARFSQLDAQAQHHVRKRLKRLRYLAQSTESLFATRPVRKYIDALKPAQDALGLYNDELIALQAYRLLAARDPAAWFGVGWLSARRDVHAAQCQKTLKRLADRKPFWR